MRDLRVIQGGAQGKASSLDKARELLNLVKGRLVQGRSVRFNNSRQVHENLLSMGFSLRDAKPITAKPITSGSPPRKGYMLSYLSGKVMVRFKTVGQGKTDVPHMVLELTASGSGEKEDVRLKFSDKGRFALTSPDQILTGFKKTDDPHSRAYQDKLARLKEKLPQGGPHKDWKPMLVMNDSNAVGKARQNLGEDTHPVCPPGFDVSFMNDLARSHSKPEQP